MAGDVPTASRFGGAADLSGDQAASSTQQSLFNWLEQQPELAELRRMVDKMQCEYRPGESTPQDRITVCTVPELETRKGVLKTLLDIVWVPGASMRGKAYATPELDASLNSVAKLMCISTLWDFFTTIPLFQFSLSGPMGLASGPGAIVLSFLLLWSSNVAGENATDRRRGHSAKATWSLAAFVFLCTAKTLFSGVGVDLWIGSRGIAANYAAELGAAKLVKDKAELKRLETEGADFKTASDRCADLQQQMRSIDRNTNDTQYISLFVQAYGSNALTTADQGKTPKQLIAKYGSVSSIKGVCRQRDVLQQLNKEKSAPLAAAIERRSRAIASKPPLAYLRTEEPDLYAEHFREVNDRFEWVNGTEAVGQATNQFYSNLFAGQFGILGFSLFTLSVSVILTGAASIMIYLISLNRQVKASFSGELQQHSNELLQEYQRFVDAMEAGVEPLADARSVGEESTGSLTDGERGTEGSQPMPPIRDAERFDMRTLRWLRLNGRTAEDKIYAKRLYHVHLFDLWRKHIAATGQTYYPDMRNDLYDYFVRMEIEHDT